MDTPVVHWQAEPTTRGTTNILSSCLSTLFLCVWSAVHVNLLHGKTKLSNFVSKVGWVVVGLLAPEYLLVIAIQQLRAACILTVEVHDAFPLKTSMSRFVRLFAGNSKKGNSMKPGHSEEGHSKEGNSNEGIPSEEGNSKKDPATNESPMRKHEWTLKHSFYAVMGGFVLQDPHSKHSQGEAYLPEWQRNGVLTIHGLRIILNHESTLFPDIPVEHISDRSKADSLAKALAAGQLLWFCVNCLNRLIQGLPISLLEVTTISYALCAMLTYFVWWNKPKDLWEPIPIAGDLRQLGAWMSMRSGAARFVLGGIPISCEPEQHWIGLDARPSRLISWTPTWVRKFMVHWGPLPWYLKAEGPEADSPESILRTQRQNLSSEASSRYGLKEPQNDPVYGQPTFIMPEVHLQASGEGVPPSAKIAWIYLPAILLISSPYLLGWPVNLVGDTTSAVQRSLWRAATILAMTCWPDGASGMMFVYLKEYKTLCRIVNFTSALVYVVASGYLLVESFLELFSLPEDAYRLPSWGHYWPHFS